MKNLYLKKVHAKFCEYIIWTNKHTPNEPPCVKTNNVAKRPAKTQITQDIRPVWSESSLSAQWVGKDPSFLHGNSEKSDHWAVSCG